jgi:tetratricopeptide (TPR) repeat protein
MHLFKGEYASAESSYKALASNSQREVRSLGRLALALIPARQGKFEEALQVLDDGLAADRMEQTAGREYEKCYAKAWIYLGRREPERALEEARLAKELHDKVYPDDPARIGAMHAYFLAESGRIAEAEELLREVKKDIKGDDPALTSYYLASLGAVELVKGNPSTAVTHLERVQRESLSPRFLVSYVLAEAYLESEKLAEAVALLEQLLSSYDENRAFTGFWSVMGHYLLGVAYERSGWNDKAVEQYREFLDICKEADPGLDVIRDAKERLARLGAAS